MYRHVFIDDDFLISITLVVLHIFFLIFLLIRVSDSHCNKDVFLEVSFYNFLSSHNNHSETFTVISALAVLLGLINLAHEGNIFKILKGPDLDPLCARNFIP